MDLERFAEFVTEKNDEAGDQRVQSVFLKASILDAQFESRTSSPADIQECLADARAKEESTTKQAGSDRSMPAVDPEINLIAGRVFDELEEPASALRKVLFGSREIPFQRWEDAAEWIRSTAEKYKVNYDASERDRLIGECEEICSKLSRLVDTPVSFPVTQYQTLEYLPTSEGQFVPEARVLLSNRELRPLYEFATEVSKGSGLSVATITYFVLTGERIMPGTSVTIDHMIFAGRVPQTVVTIPKALASWEDFQQAFSYLKSKRSNKKGLGEVRKFLVATLRLLGGIPHRGIGEFWEAVAAIVKNEFGMESYTSKAARSCYDRLPQDTKASLKAGARYQAQPVNGAESGNRRASSRNSPVRVTKTWENTQVGTIARGKVDFVVIVESEASQSDAT